MKDKSPKFCISVSIHRTGVSPLKMNGFAKNKIAVNSKKNALDDDEKIGAREVIRGVLLRFERWVCLHLVHQCRRGELQS